MMRPALLLAAALLPFAAPALAQEPASFRWDPKKTRVPEVGERWFVEDERTYVIGTDVVVPGAPPKHQESREERRSRVVHEVVAVADGKITRRRVTVEEWQVTLPGARPDRSLEARTILVEGTGAERRATVEGGERGLSATALKWIDEELVKPKGSSGDFIEPPQPVGEGEQWDLDPAVLAREMFRDAEIDLAASSGKGRLANVRVIDGAHFGRLEIDIAFKLRHFPGTDFPLTGGGVVRMRMSGFGQLDPPGHKGHGEISLRGDAAVERETPEGVRRVTMEMDATGRYAEGAVPSRPGGPR